MIDALFDRVRAWFDRTPKAKRAYERLSADADGVVARLDSSTRGNLRDAIEARIDPPRTDATPMQKPLPAGPEAPGRKEPDRPAR